MRLGKFSNGVSAGGRRRTGRAAGALCLCYRPGGSQASYIAGVVYSPPAARRAFYRHEGQYRAGGGAAGPACRTAFILQTSVCYAIFPAGVGRKAIFTDLHKNFRHIAYISPQRGTDCKKTALTVIPLQYRGIFSKGLQKQILNAPLIFLYILSGHAILYAENLK